MDNRTLQNDEIQALSAIYGKEWIIEDKDNCVYSITLKNNDLNNDNQQQPAQQQQQQQQSHEWDKTITLQFRLLPNYPSDQPPLYTLSAPWMSSDMKKSLKSSLEEIYRQNEGESILFMWVEKAREFLIDDQNDNTGHKSSDEDEDYDNESSNSSSLRKKDNCQSLNDESSNGSNDSHKYQYHGHHHHHHHHHHHNDHHHSSSVPIYHGEPIVDRRSTFQAHLSPVHCVDEVQKALITLKTNKRISNATHNISAYRISGGPHNTCIQDCDDDGENHAGSRLLHLLQILDVKDVVVVVSRWYGGIQLGPDRFKHINNAARDILQKCGYIDNHHDDDTNHSGKGKKKSK